MGNKFLTNAGFPDFAIMTIEESEMIGVVEIKRLAINLDLEKVQAEKHQYRKIDKGLYPLVVLYTNGLEWRLYVGGFGEIKKKRISIGKINKGKIEWENDNWIKLIELLDGIDWTGASYQKQTKI
jgi:hypothetical protein